MNTAPKPIDLLKRHSLAIAALVLGLALGYGMGASRANYAVVYAPAPAAVFPGAISSGAPAAPAAQVSAAPAQTASASPIFVQRPAPTAASAQTAAASVAAQPQEAAAQARPTAAQRLSSRQALGSDGARERSSAFAQNAEVDQPSQTTAARAAAPTPVARAASAPTRSIAAGGAIRYGTASRSEIMGRGAGPVLNFQGSTGANPNEQQVNQAVGATYKNTTQILDVVTKQLDAPGVPAELRQQLTTSLKQTQSGLQQVQAGVPGQ